MKQVTIADFVPGRILYHVYGIHRKQTRVEDDAVCKYIVLGKPYIKSLGTNYDAYFCKVRVVYLSDGVERSYDTDISLGDCGVLTHVDRSVHNLNRVFVSKADAFEFCAELQADKFSRKEDADYAKIYTPEREREDREMWAWGDIDVRFDDSDWDYEDTGSLYIRPIKGIVA